MLMARRAEDRPAAQPVREQQLVGELMNALRARIRAGLIAAEEAFRFFFFFFKLPSRFFTRCGKTEGNAPRVDKPQAAGVGSLREETALRGR